MKRIFAILMAVCLLVATLAGCGNSGVMNSPTKSKSETADTTASSGGLGSGAGAGAGLFQLVHLAPEPLQPGRG